MCVPDEDHYIYHLRLLVSNCGRQSQLAFDERFGMLVDQPWLWKENRAPAHRLRSARWKERGVMEDIYYQHARGLDRKLMRTLAHSEWTA
jgi:hypothetical protein